MDNGAASDGMRGNVRLAGCGWRGQRTERYRGFVTKTIQMQTTLSSVIRLVERDSGERDKQTDGHTVVTRRQTRHTRGTGDLGKGRG